MTAAALIESEMISRLVEAMQAHLLEQASNTTQEHAFGSGGAMIMYMDGFHWALFKRGSYCLNLFFASWTLDSYS
jgi:hypothetical protein